MSEIKKVSEDQLKVLQELNAQYELLVRRSGELTFELEVTKAAMLEVHQNRAAMVEALEVEFGTGTVDLKTGEFRPSE